MAQFTFENVTFTYPQANRPTLDNISLEIEAGSYVVLCGKSGCGKTTLLRHLKSALTPHGDTQGIIRFNGTPMAEVDPKDQAALIGFVMQNPDAQVVTDKVWHELAFGLESLGTDQRVMRMRVAEMANYFGIQHWFHKDVRDLSGGQKQLLNLASIMAMQPQVLILDEPTSQLDPIAAADFLNTVRKINQELGTTIIITEHRLEDVFPAADRVLVMESGRIAADGTPSQVGNQLHAANHDMQAALPAPMRIFYGVHDDATKEDLASASIPLTVRDGRSWLSAKFAEKAAAQPDACIVSAGEEFEEADDDNLALQVKEAWFRYGRDLPDVLRDCNLEVPNGSLFAIVGGNGTGKSTMLRAACGIAKPYRGKIRVLGRAIKDFKRGELFHDGVALLPQDPQNLFVKKTVREDLTAIAKDHGSESRIDEVARIAQIQHVLDSHPFDLSGGEIQRAALAMVLLCQPRLLMMDEPTKGLDNFFKEQFAGILNELRAQGITILMVSHDIEFCASYATHVAMFFDGGVTTANTPQRFFAQNSFYTTAANRMSRHIFQNAVTDQDVITLCKRL